MSLTGTTVWLMVGGPVLAVDAPAALMESVRSVQVTQSEAGSGFQIAFDVDPAPGASGSTGPGVLHSLLLKPYNRVVIGAALNGTSTVLMDGVITHMELSPAQGGQPSTFTVTGSDLTAVMDLWELSREFPAASPAMTVAEILLPYILFGIVPLVIPSGLSVPPLPVERVPIQNCTDLAFIRQLACENGYDFHLRPGPVPLTNVAYWGPRVRIGMLKPALSVNLGPGTNVDALTFSYDATAPTITYGSVLEETTNLEVPVVGVPLFNLPPFAAAPAIVVNVPYVRASLFQQPGRTWFESMRMASAQVTRSVENVLVAKGELDSFRYGTALTARSLVGVRGAGYEYDGIYYVHSVTHTLQAGSWRQSFELVREGLGTTTPLVMP
ncbi:MAG TPA: hypothetical protein VFT45_18100 [Longimicrobium sp.]|nr:hypothetical protein [Longimicrobium sp.]